MTSGYELLFAKEASKVIRKLDKVTAKRILQAIESLSVNPCHHPKTKLMKGYEGQFYRLKVGNWRIIYEVIEHQLLIVIIRIGPRGDVYKKPLNKTVVAVHSWPGTWAIAVRLAN